MVCDLGASEMARLAFTVILIFYVSEASLFDGCDTQIIIIIIVVVLIVIKTGKSLG